EQLGHQGRDVERPGEVAGGDAVARQQAPGLGRGSHGHPLSVGLSGRGECGVRPAAGLPGWDSPALYRIVLRGKREVWSAARIAAFPFSLPRRAAADDNRMPKLRSSVRAEPDDGARCRHLTPTPENGLMLLTITTTHRPAHDLGRLLHKHPDRLQSFELSFG